MINLDQELVVGLDIGGTQLKFGFVSGQGEVLNFKVKPIERTDEGNADIHSMVETIAHFLQEYKGSRKISSLGVSTPGVIDTDQGIVKTAVNLGWGNLPLRRLLEERLGLPVSVINDAEAGALGEYHFGSGRHKDRFLFVSLGTGIGASLCIDGRIYKGRDNTIINLGHNCIFPNGRPCECGNRGCLEKYVSGPALSAQGGKDAVLLYEAAGQGDANARQIFQDAGQVLGMALVSCLNLFGVDTILVGGGLSQSGPYLMEPARKIIGERYKLKRDWEVILAANPLKAGMLGAAVMAFNDLKERG
ncbi:ROK family protein [Paenibacillus nasutitermitis]|uniref:Sugar kinase n=1 Tax=Paenibacillus nasutitermitis TaxID=1652958 RepID=A0A916YV46_9BACL|nr:ROK family protein [Paenibacillus nasutitermitis]GGD62872.1 sugar kinase [Paenibacillus nasutitermitis]